MAHVRALQDAGLLTPTEAGALEEALADVGNEIGEGRFRFDDADEDVHSAIERAVTDRLGDLGAKLHAGRSRNDLVVTDLRLWLLAAGRRIDARLGALVEALVARAREHESTVMPGTTHARFAQPVTLGHHLLAHGWAFARDLERFAEWAVRTSTSPLGRGGDGDLDARARPRPDRGAARVPPGVPQLDRRGERSRLRPGVPRRRDDRARPTCRGSRPTSRAGPTSRSDGQSSTRPTPRVEHDAAEAEPGHGRARPREGGARGRGVRGRHGPAAGAAARLPPRSAGGQGARLRRRRHAGARAAGADGRGGDRCGSTRRRCARPARRAGCTRPIWRRRSCATGCRSARRTGARGSC